MKNTFARARLVKVNDCFGCVPEETLQTTEKRSPFPGKIIVICCFYWSIKLQANSDQCVFFSLTHCKPRRLCLRSIGSELFLFLIRPSIFGEWSWMEETSTLGAPFQRSTRHHFVAFSAQDAASSPTAWGAHLKKLETRFAGKVHGMQLQLF